MKKYLTASLIAFSLLFASASAFAAGENPTTNSATGITETDATLNATNGTGDAVGHSFWASLNTFDTSSPTLPSGVYSTPDLGPISSSTPFSALLSTVNGLGPISSSTTYYFAGWSNVSGTWYPGSVESFTTASPNVAVTGVNIDDSSASIEVGNTHQLTASTTPSDATNQNISWDSSNTGVATVDSTGLVTAVAEGTTTITATTQDGGFTDTADITVTPVASSVPTCNGSTFDGFSTGSVNGQGGWSSTGGFDEGVVDNNYGYTSFGCKVFRLSNAIASDGFGNQTFTPSTANEAGETGATNNGLSGGTRQNHYEAQFDFTSAQAAVQPDLSVSVSPDRGDGSRMSYLAFNDTVGGIDVVFYDVQGTDNPANFVPTTVATGLSRTAVHTAKFVIDYVDGPSNDIVKIYIDGNLVHTGTTWENYYRYDSEASAEQTTRTTDSLIFRVKNPAQPANSGKGFLFDNFDAVAGGTLSSHTLTYTAADSNGVITGTTVQTVEDGTDGTEVTAVPNNGYHFGRWSDGVTTASRTDLNVTSDINVSASFLHDQSSGGTSSGSRGHSSHSTSTGGQVLGASTDEEVNAGCLPGAAFSSTTGRPCINVFPTFKFLFDLRLGMNNENVAQLQARLRAEGYFTYPTNTGYFGPITFAAAKAYQTAHPEIGYVTGFVGPLTRAVLNK
ncbi:MAG: Ig-like domain-containing protein [Patescibacteria group bacterium]